MSRKTLLSYDQDIVDEIEARDEQAAIEDTEADCQHWPLFICNL